MTKRGVLLPVLAALLVPGAIAVAQTGDGDGEGLPDGESFASFGECVSALDQQGVENPDQACREMGVLPPGESGNVGEGGRPGENDGDEGGNSGGGPQGTPGEGPSGFGQCVAAKARQLESLSGGDEVSAAARGLAEGCGQPGAENGNGPPEGLPGPAQNAPRGRPDGVPQGPPEGVSQRPPDGVPQGPPEGVPQGPPAGTPGGRP